MVLIAGFGNPLLDITVKIKDQTLLKKYNLNEDDAKEIPSSQIMSLLQDVTPLKPKFSPGGAIQNTLRILQWVLSRSESTVMFGAIGQDVQGTTLKSLVEAAGLQTRYTEHKNEPTGIVIALVSGSNRSLVAYIGAANYITTEDLQLPHNDSILQSSDLILMEGFFIPNRQDVAKYIQQYTQDNNKIFVFNLGAPYITTTFPNEIQHFAQNCDILIGNRKEYESLCKASNLAIDTRAFIRKLAETYNNSKNLTYGKLIVMTNGAKSVLCAHSNGQLEEIPVLKIDPSKIVDTTGAGDAFAAGFLAGMLSERTPIGCLKWGCWVAQQIIQQSGCTIPNYSAEYLKNID